MQGHRNEDLAGRLASSFPPGEGAGKTPSPLAGEGRGEGASDVEACPETPDWNENRVDSLVEAMAEDWKRGVRTTAEEVMAGNPGLDDEAAIRLIYEETCLRRESGQEVATSEVVRRFPRGRAELEILLRCDRLMRPPVPIAFPEVGDRLGDFDLLGELGRGASGRTFLASQPALADRPVVLKLMPGHLDEHLSLAGLQHTHIVPLYSAQLFPDRGLRGLCMPYLGGSNLSRLLADLSELDPARRTGRHLLEALDRPGKSPSAAPGPFRRFLERASYVRAICWIGACLADALQYAHDRGLVHMDVKPSNVLIAGDGQPMLLDFHLARGPVVPGEDIPDRLGGTPSWMAPEQQAAMEAMKHGRAVALGVDGRADLYSLGLLLDHALGGTVPKAGGSAAPRLNRRNPAVSVGLADVIEKCLRRDPDDRYASPGALADDLRRHLDDRPLRGVPNRSLAERWRKWRRRRPQALVRGSAGLSTMAAALVVLAIAGESYRHRLSEVDSALADARRLRLAGQFAEALHSAERGVEIARQWPPIGRRTSDFDKERRLSIRGKDARDIHELADLLRFRSGSGFAASESARSLERRCRTVWDERASFAGPGETRLDEATERRLGEDLVELATVWADLHVRLAPAETVVEARREALRVLDEAALSGLSPALARERLELARAIGLPETAAGPIPEARSAWEHRELGRSSLRAGRFEAAADEFRAALDLDPRDFWANFHLGACDYRLGRFEDALAAFRVCVALSPETAECYFNRGLAFESLGRLDRAALDYSKALERDPALAAAAFNRGLLTYKAGRPREAAEDFRRALKSDPGRAMTGPLHYNLALAQLALEDRAAARASLAEAARLDHAEARALLDRLPP